MSCRSRRTTIAIIATSANSMAPAANIEGLVQAMNGTIAVIAVNIRYQCENSDWRLVATSELLSAIQIAFAAAAPPSNTNKRGGATRRLPDIVESRRGPSTNRMATNGTVVTTD